MTRTTQPAAVLMDLLLGRVLMAALRRQCAGVILVYHRVTSVADPAFAPLPPEIFEEHCRAIKQWLSVMPLSVFAERHRHGRSLKGCCAITFDDGYRDFLEYAYPILERHSLPATHFLVTDCLASGLPTWNLRLNRQFWHGRDRSRKASDSAALHPREVAALKRQLGKLSAAERYAWLEVREAAQPDLPPPPPMLRPEDLTECDPRLIEWGSHTVSHAMLAYCDRETLQRELRESRRLLEEQTGCRQRFISYPNNSYTSEVVRAAEEAGYACALAVDQRPVGMQSSLYALPRLDVGYMRTAMLRLELGGALGFLREIRARLTGGTG
jgi:peptidoglycan/xylan/chitin deacetylase (PgdA/CDA1 family)